MKQSYGEFIKQHRLSSGYKSQRHLAERSGISSATISRIENEIQKPEVETLQTLAKVLESTSFVEMMVICGYWGEDELLENGPIKWPEVKKETPASDKNEEEFVNDINLSDEDLLNKYELKIDGKSLSEDETQGIIAYIRSLRQMKN